MACSKAKIEFSITVILFLLASVPSYVTSEAETLIL